MPDTGGSRRSFLKNAGLGLVAAPLLAQLADAERAAARATAEATSGGLGAALRPAYSLDPKITYLNHASIGTIPKAVQAAHVRYLELCEANPWLHIWGGEWEEARERVRAKAAALLGCPAEGVALTHNTTEAFNLLAHGLPLGPGDEVLFSSLNHPGASVCWRDHGERRGYAVRRFDFPTGDVPGMGASEVVDLHLAALRPETRVLVLPAVDNSVGLRHPVAALAAAVKKAGVDFVAVDAAQTVGMLPVDLPLDLVDAYATSPHKWLQAPKGLGLAYLAPRLREALQPLWVTWGQERWRGTVRIFEDYGTRNLPAVLALGDAIDFQQRLGAEVKEGHHRRLWAYAREAVAARSDLVWRSPTAWAQAAALWAVEVRSRSSRELAADLFRDHGIVVRPFEGGGLNALRLSPNVAETTGAIDRLLEAVRGVAV